MEILFLVHSPAFWINGMSSGIERSSPVRKIHDSANIGVLRILLEMGVSLLYFGVFKRGHDDKAKFLCVPRYLFGCPRYEKINHTFQVSVNDHNLPRFIASCHCWSGPWIGWSLEKSSPVNHRSFFRRRLDGVFLLGTELDGKINQPETPKNLMVKTWKRTCFPVDFPFNKSDSPGDPGLFLSATRLPSFRRSLPAAPRCSWRSRLRRRRGTEQQSLALEINEMSWIPWIYQEETVFTSPNMAFSQRKHRYDGIDQLFLKLWWTLALNWRLAAARLVGFTPTCPSDELGVSTSLKPSNGGFLK